MLAGTNVWPLRLLVYRLKQAVRLQAVRGRVRSAVRSGGTAIKPLAFAAANVFVSFSRCRRLDTVQVVCCALLGGAFLPSAQIQHCCDVLLYWCSSFSKRRRATRLTFSRLVCTYSFTSDILYRFRQTCSAQERCQTIANIQLMSVHIQKGLLVELPYKPWRRLDDNCAAVHHGLVMIRMLCDVVGV